GGGLAALLDLGGRLGGETASAALALLGLFPGLDRGLAALAVLGLLLRRLDQLEERHLGRVAGTALADAHDARVAARPLRVPRGDRVEELLRHRLAIHEARDVAARVQIVALGARDQTLGEAARLLGLGHGSVDALVLEQSRDEIAEQRLAMLHRAAELFVITSVTHGLTGSFAGTANS